MVSVTEEHRMAATTQAPITVSLETKDKIRYLAALKDASQARIARRHVHDESRRA